jgi:hypothetical protein
MFRWILLLIIILSIYYTCTQNKAPEQFIESDKNKVIFGTPHDGIRITNDDLFTDVITYQNDKNPYKAGGKTGLEKCIESCNGRCIEFGVSGMGICHKK